MSCFLNGVAGAPDCSGDVEGSYCAHHHSWLRVSALEDRGPLGRLFRAVQLAPQGVTLNKATSLAGRTWEAAYREAQRTPTFHGGRRTRI